MLNIQMEAFCSNLPARVPEQKCHQFLLGVNTVHKPCYAHASVIHHARIDGCISTL